MSEDRVKVGMRVRDNDPRSASGVFVVIGFISSPRGQKAHLRRDGGSYRETYVSENRIYTDGKPRRAGWSVVHD